MNRAIHHAAVVLLLPALGAGCGWQRTRLAIEPELPAQSAASSAVEQSAAQEAVAGVCEDLGLALNPNLIVARALWHDSPEFADDLLVNYDLPPPLGFGKPDLRVFLVRGKVSGAVSVLISASPASNAELVALLESRLKAALAEAVPGSRITVSRD